MENKFLGADPCLEDGPKGRGWNEFEIQAYIVMELRRAGYVVHGDANGASKTPKGWGQAQAAGMMPGWPDLCIMVFGRPMWVELKTKDGRLSKEQKGLHAHMTRMGYPCAVVKAATPADGLEKVRVLLR